MRESLPRTHPVNNQRLLIQITRPIRRRRAALLSIIAILPSQVHQNRTRVVQNLVADDETRDFTARVDFQILWRVLLVGLREFSIVVALPGRNAIATGRANGDAYLEGYLFVLEVDSENACEESYFPTVARVGSCV
jgi:hypothetical protein